MHFFLKNFHSISGINSNKFNYFIADRVFTSFPPKKLKDKEIFVGNYFNESMSNLVDNKTTAIQVLLLGGSAGSLELNKILIKELKFRIDNQLP